MKKSYDYFKTFKTLAEQISLIYEKTVNNEDFSSAAITFFAVKSELLNNLQTEFITPFDRGDIFLLEECLSGESELLFGLREISGLVNLKDYTALQDCSQVLKNQTVIFSQLKNLKSNIKLFEFCSDEVRKLNQLKNVIEKRIIDAVFCKNEQPLLQYVVYSKVLELNRCIHKTLVETERILIINS